MQKIDGRSKTRHPRAKKYRFCENEGLNWLDFSGRRPVFRPTYKYFAYLISHSGRSAEIINQYTGVVFDFYRLVFAIWHDIDLQRIDTAKGVKLFIKNS
ncbi:hypothetical protein [Pseudomonas fluorescens]|uniref:hypothetical protein n=1 Tax=Pseudomonas fluorescens TaxID=294 RepID=UPI001242E225|nr:hypothetical protein [Pseudomonas fluorescens]